MKTERDIAAAYAALDRAVALVSEHCDAVQIVCTVYDADAGLTHTLARGLGNWQARKGACDAWMRADQNADLVDKLQPRKDD